jgi:hypothetical protein
MQQRVFTVSEVALFRGMTWLPPLKLLLRDSRKFMVIALYQVALSAAAW